MKTFLTVTLLCCSSVLFAQNLNVGIRLQKTNGMYWENGISAQYTFAGFKPKQMYVGFDFVSSSLGTAINSNALKQNSFIFSGSWYFQKDKAFRLLARLNLGYLKANLEYEIFDDLPNSAFLFSPEFGMCYTFKNLPIALNTGIGYYVSVQPENKTPGTFQPLYYHFTAYYQLFKD